MQSLKAAGKKKTAKSRRKVVEYLGWEWYETEKFKIEKLIGKMVAERVRCPAAVASRRYQGGHRPLQGVLGGLPS